MLAEIGKQYRHYKNQREYTVLQIGRFEADPAVECVVYRAEYESPDFRMGSVWVRSRENFEEMVEVEGVTVSRFTLIDLA